MQEIEERWQQDNPSGRAQVAQLEYEGRRAALDGIIAEMLIQEAAEASGVSVEEFETAEMARRAVAITEADIVSFFQGNQNQMQGRGLAAMSPLIRQFLEEQALASAYSSLVTELRGAAGVMALLDAPRLAVAIAPDDASIGPETAAVTLVEFSDFQCPFCRQTVPTLERIRETYGDQVRVVWKDFPLTQIHPEAFKAAEAGNCAREQGRFWEYHDQLFDNQQALRPDDLKQHAVAAGLDEASFNACLDSARHGGRVQEHVSLGTELGINSTPTVFINGRRVTGAQPYETFAAIIDEELERASAR